MRVKSWPKKSYEAANGGMCEMLTPLFGIFEDGGAAVEILWWTRGGGGILWQNVRGKCQAYQHLRLQCMPGKEHCSLLVAFRMV